MLKGFPRFDGRFDGATVGKSVPVASLGTRDSFIFFCSLSSYRKRHPADNGSTEIVNPGAASNNP